MALNQEILARLAEAQDRAQATAEAILAELLRQDAEDEQELPPAELTTTSEITTQASGPIKPEGT